MPRRAFYLGPVTDNHPDYHGLSKTSADKRLKKDIRAYLDQHSPEPPKPKPHLPDHRTKLGLCLGFGQRQDNAGRWFVKCLTCDDFAFITDRLSSTVLDGLKDHFAMMKEINAPSGPTTSGSSSPVTGEAGSTSAAGSSASGSSSPATRIGMNSNSASGSSSSSITRTKRRRNEESPTAASQKRARRSRFSSPLPPSSPPPSSPVRPMVRLPRPFPMAIPASPQGSQPTVAGEEHSTAPLPEEVDQGDLFDLGTPVTILIELDDGNTLEENLYPRRNFFFRLADYKMLFGRLGFEQGRNIEYFNFTTDSWTPCLWNTPHYISHNNNILQFRYAL